MKLRLVIFFTLVFLGSTNIVCVNKLYKLRTGTWQESISHFSSLNKEVAKGLVLEFRGLASDYLMLQTLTFLGGKIIENERLTDKEWRMVYLALKQVINLDPRFLDPYVVAEMSLPWEGGMVEETNELLKQAIKARPNDHRPFFFLWYNYYYLLKDPKTAGFYLQQAAQKPGAPAHYATLAARMYLYSGELNSSIMFLKEILAEATDPAMKKWLETRLDATKRIAFIEQKIQLYRKQYHKKPANLDDLIRSGILKKIPMDPYGGQFYITEYGRVYTTSKLVPTQKQQPNKHK